MAEMRMSHSSLKRKYLQKAQNIIGKTEQNLKLQASVEPFVHQSQHPSQPSKGQKCAPMLERSNSDPSSHSFTAFPPSPGQLQEGGRQKELLDSCSDSDSQSVYSYRSLPTLHPPPDKVPSYTDLHQRGPIAVSTREHYGGYVSPNSSPMVQRMSIDPHLYPFSSTPAPNTHTYGHTHASYNDGTQRTYSTNRSDTEVGRLTAQLKVQTEVNRELKRLLVASVGGDIQLHLDQIVQDKAELSRGLDASLQQLADNSEEFDRILIDCDIWRSKFLASRLMIDELASWKAELSIQFKEVHRALQCLMKERKSLCRELTECSTYLRGAVEGLQSSMAQRSGVGVHTEGGALTGASWQSGGGPSGRVATVTPVQYPNKGRLSSHLPRQSTSGLHHATVLEIAQTLNSMAKTLNQLLSDGRMVPQTTRSMEVVGGRGAQRHSPPHEQRHQVTQPTVGERLARQVLQGKEKHIERRLPLPLRLSDEELATLRVQNRTMSSLSHSRLQCFDDDSSGTHLFHCKKCKGKVLNL